MAEQKQGSRRRGKRGQAPATSREPTPSEQTEQAVRRHFETRGWAVTKLDTKGRKASDFLMSRAHERFLCEVKTIESVRANYPGTALEYHLEERRRRREEIDRWHRENPDTHIILRPEEYQYLYGDQAEFEQRYRARSRNTQWWFRGFANDLKEHLASSEIATLPYTLRLDSDGVYVPKPSEKATFFAWLVEEIRAIHGGRPSRAWQREQLLGGLLVSYSARYQIHRAAGEGDAKAEYSLALEGPRKTGTLEVHAFSYGGLNLAAVTDEVRKAVSQLEKSASREHNKEIPRAIALAFDSQIDFDEWPQLSCHLTWLLSQHPHLSAIAVLQMVPEGNPPPQDAGFSAWVRFWTESTWVPRFAVYHNPLLRDVSPLPVGTFDESGPADVAPTPS